MVYILPKYNPMGKKMLYSLGITELNLSFKVLQITNFENPWCNPFYIRNILHPGDTDIAREFGPVDKIL